MRKRLLPILLVLVMVLALVPTIALAGGSSSNVNLTADKTTANVGDTITVTVANKVMKVDTFTCGISFDKTLLECTGITKGTNYTTMQSKGVVAPEISTVTEANEAGYVGFGVACAVENSYSVDTIFTVSFKVLKEGTATISSTEVSNGTDGFKGDGMNLTLTLKAAGGLIGDVNCDTVVDSKDILLLKRAVAGLTTLNAQQSANANVNHDSTIDSKDILLLKRAVAGLTTLS